MGTSSRAWLAAALLALSVGAALARTHVLRHATRPAAPQQPQSAASQQGLYSEPIVIVPVKEPERYPGTFNALNPHPSLPDWMRTEESAPNRPFMSQMGLAVFPQR